MPPNDRGQRMLAKYRRVTADRLAMLVPALEGLEPKTAAPDRIAAIKRELHTVKGEARMLKLHKITQLAHGIEDLFISAVDDRVYSEYRDHLVVGLDLISKLAELNDPFAVTESPEVDAYLAAGLALAQKAANTPDAEPATFLSPSSTSDSASVAEDRSLRLVQKLRDTTDQRLGRIREALNVIAEAPGDTGGRETLRREIHTVKGDTRLMKFVVASDVAAAVEALLHKLSSNGGVEAALPRIHRGLDLIGELVHVERPYPQDLLDRAKQFRLQTDSLAPESIVASARPMYSEPPSDPSNGAEDDAAGQELSSYVNVDAAHLASLTTVAGELIVRHEQVDRSIADMQRIAEDILQDLGEVARVSNAAGAEQAAIARRRDFIPRLHALGRELLSTIQRAKDEQFDGRLHLTALQGEIREVRMVRVGDLFVRHSRAVRELARDMGKRVSVRTEGIDVTVDKHVLDHLDEPLLHLVRNAVDHAFGTPEQRTDAGKPERGELQLIAREAGGHVLIEVRDDGAGIDPEAVRSTAVRRGVLGQDEALTLDKARSLALLFRPGFSTREEASEISGRGVGLDVVRTELAELGGSVSVDSNLGEGTRFVLRCPISVAFASGLVVKAADELYALPSTSVVEVLHIAIDEVETVGPDRAVVYHDRRVPLIPLAHLLGVASRGAGDHLKVVIVQAESLVALQVDSVLGEREAVRRNLNRFLAGVSIITGTATVEGRRLVMFVNLPELLGRTAQVAHGAEPLKFAEHRKYRILIVDDSELTRDMLVSLLERLGYSVDEAVDGAEALHAIQRSTPDLILTDLDMPVMDGFTLVERLRAKQAMQDLPVIVFSTRGSEADKQRAMEAGANGYLVKSAFHAEELHKTLQRHLSHLTH